MSASPAKVSVGVDEADDGRRPGTAPRRAPTPSASARPGAPSAMVSRPAHRNSSPTRMPTVVDRRLVELQDHQRDGDPGDAGDEPDPPVAGDFARGRARTG